VRVQEWTGDIINIVPWIADAEGIFQKHCLNVKFVTLLSGPGAYAALVNGSIDFSNGAPDGIMRSRANGVDLKLIANMYAGQWSSLVGRPGLALPHLDEGYPAIMQDLIGKKIGVTVLGGTTEAFVQSAFNGAGLDPSSATYVAVGGVATALPALKNGVIDAAITGGIVPDLAEAMSAGKIILDLRKRGIGPASVQALWGATLSWASYTSYIVKNPSVVAAFATANNEAITWIQDRGNREELYRVVGKRLPLTNDPSKAETALKRIVDVHAGVLGVGIPRESISGWNRYLVSLKQIDQPILYDALVWKTGMPQ
jgi:NitT/TauT family transport system substrate-binding protein